jgi:hypothetical protein
MANPHPAIKPGAVPDPQEGNEIENDLNAHRELEEAIEELKKQRPVAKAELTERFACGT